jgi:hypothetical protein
MARCAGARPTCFPSLTSAAARSAAPAAAPPAVRLPASARTRADRAAPSARSAVTRSALTRGATRLAAALRGRVGLTTAGAAEDGEGAQQHRD